MRTSWSLALAGLFLAARLAAGGTPAPQGSWDHSAFSSDPAVLVRAAAEVPAPAGADAVVLLEEGAYSFDAEGRCTYRWTLVYRVVTEAGVRGWASVDAGWAKWYEERPDIRVRVSTPDGVGHALDPSTIEEAPAGSDSSEVYSDRRLLRAPLPALSVGAVVEQEIVTHEHRPLLDGGVSRRFYFGRGVPVQRARLILEAPTTLPLRYRARLVSLEPQRTESQGRTRWVFDAGPLAALPPVEPDLPSDVHRWPHVAFSTGASWADVAGGYGRIVDAQIAASPAGLRWDKGPQGREAIVAQVLERLHRDVRYTGVEFGDAAIVPRTPAETLRRQYGDCKDQATLVVATLRAAGLPAHVALLRTGPGEDVDSEVPGLGRFNHAIAVVDGAPQLWIDPTDPHARAGELPLTDAGRLALIAGPETTGLLRTPDAGSADNRVVATREYLLAERGPARVVETTEMWGSIEARYRAWYAESDPRKLAESRERHALSEHGAKTVTHHENSDPHDLRTRFRLRLEAGGAQRGQTDEGEAVVAIFPAKLLYWLPDDITASEPDDAAAKTSKRAGEYVLEEPFVAEWRYRITPPVGFTPQALPKPDATSLGPASLTTEFAAGRDGVVTATLRFDTGRARLTPEEHAALRAGVQKLQAEDAILVRFEQAGEARLAAGHIKDALGEFRKLESLHPKEALHHTQVARTLLAGGLGDAAGEEARRAVAVEPDSALAYRTLGWVLEHNALGRRFRKGFDAAASEAAYRRAKELDPEDGVGRADLAILLEHDAEGVWRGPKARLAEAIVELKSLRADLDQKTFDLNLLVDLVSLGRFVEVRETVASASASPTRDACHLVAIAATEGVAAAAATAATLAPDPAKRREILEIAANSLVNVRRYAEGAALLAEAAQGSPSAAALRARSDALRKVLRHEVQSLPPDDPTSVVKRLLVATWLMSDFDAGVLAPLFDRPEEILAEAKNGREGLRRALLGVTALRRDQLPAAVLADVSLSLLQIVVEGEDGVGYRVRAKGGADGRDELYFVVRRADGYRILTAGRALDRVGHEVLRLAEAGDLSAARRWLDWARLEILPPGGDDPLAGVPFPRFWRPGAQGGLDEIRLAAGSLLAMGRDARQAESMLSAARAAAASDEARASLDLALAWTYLSTQRWTELEPVAERLARTSPDSASAFRLRFQALMELKRFAEGRKAADERLALHPGDPLAIRSLAGVAQRTDDLEGANDRYRQLVEAARAEPGDLNNLAWNEMVIGPVTDKALEHARQAVDLGQRRDPAALHTLAALYAASGRPAEAREVLLEAMDKAGRDDPAPHDWYVLGRIAEHYGVVDAAAGAYRRVTLNPSEGKRASTYALAQQRLAALAGHLRPGGATN